MISVVIPAHNEEGLITRAIDSVVCGTSIPFEILVVLDRCSDSTEQKVEAYRRESIRAIANEGSPGLAGALNTGLAAAKGDWVARLDADDIQRPMRLEKQLETAHRYRLDLCCGWADLIDSSGRHILDQTTPVDSRAIASALARRNVIVHSSVLMRRIPVLGYGGYRRVRWEDYDLWVRLLVAGFRFGCLSESVVIREFRPDGYGESHGRGLLGRIDTARLGLRVAFHNLMNRGSIRMHPGR